MASQPYSNYSTWVPLQAHPETYTYKPTVAVNQLEVQDAPASDLSYKRRSSGQRWLGGLKLTLRAFTFAALVVLLVNIGWLAYAKQKYGIVSRFGTIERGDCERVKKSNTWLHLLINILSTTLLAGSAAFMQAYSSPTRQEVDQAHQAGKWVYVGLLSFKNMRWISKRKSLVCLLLALSSPPFHLFQYYWVVSTEGFLSGDRYNLTEPGSMWTSPDETRTMDHIAKTVNNYTRMSSTECIRVYQDTFQGKYRHVVLIAPEKNDTNSVLLYGYSGDLDDRSFFWMCSKDAEGGASLTCDPSSITSNIDNWEVYGHRISYCLAEPVSKTCSLQFSYDVMIVVIAFNAVKLLAMVFVLWRFDVENLLPSVGDAAMSFLRAEDRTTMSICLANRADINKSLHGPRWAQPYNPYSGRWRRAASKARWLISLFLMSLALGVVTLLLAWGLSVLNGKAVSITPRGLWDLGFGTLDSRALALADSTDNAVSMAILANSPQICLALLFICYNGLVTAMFSAADWANFAVTKFPKQRQKEIQKHNAKLAQREYSKLRADGQTLMVASPRGNQRGTWLLGAPSIWGVVLFTLHVLLHWLVSQSLFMVQVDQYSVDGKLDTEKHLSNCGYSPIAIIFALVVGLLLALSAIVLGLRKFKPGSPPVVGMCSAAISAACHPGSWDDKLVYEELRWGEVGQGWNGINHCSLASARQWETGWARPVIVGQMYA